MKRFLFFLIFVTAAFHAKAQFPGGGPGGTTIVGHISGTVIDSVTKKPVDYATINLFKGNDKAPFNGVVTDEKGNFKLDNVAPGSYKVTISFLGYPTKTINPVLTTPGKPDRI